MIKVERIGRYEFAVRFDETQYLKLRRIALWLETLDTGLLRSIILVGSAVFGCFRDKVEGNNEGR